MNLFILAITKTKPLSLTTDQIVHIRPRFHLEVNYSTSEVEERILEGIQKREFPCNGSIKHGFRTISMLKAEQHFWSPQLTVTVEEVEGKTEI